MLSAFQQFTNYHYSGFFDLLMILTLNMSLSNTSRYVFRISVFSSPLRGNRHVTICTRPAIQSVIIISSTIHYLIYYHTINRHHPIPHVMSRKYGLSVNLCIEFYIV